MKKALSVLGALLCASAIFAQPELTADNIDEVIKSMTLEEKATLLVGGAVTPEFDAVTLTGPVQGAAGNTRPIERFGIPMTYLADGPAGLRIKPTREGCSRTFYCTGFPVGTLLASSWDVELVQKVTSALGNEVLEYGADVLLAPGVNIHRNPLCGRNFEYFSEDPVLSGNVAAAYITGVQSNNVGTSIKHFAANNQETNRLEDDARVSVRALREIYLKNFEIAVRKARPWTVMSSYNSLNGEYTQQSEDLLTKVLRQDWGFEGMVMTDWGCKEGTVKSVNAGNDLMEPGNRTETERIVAAVRDGRITEETLDRNVRNVLRYIVRTPSFRGYRFSNNPDLKAHALVARDAAAQSIVLLRNEDSTLPLKGDEKIALYGISSIDFVAGGTGSGEVNKAYVVNMAEGMQNAGFSIDPDLPDYYRAHIRYDAASRKIVGKEPRDWRFPEIPVPADAIRLQAGKNDAAVVVIGRNAGEGSDRNVADDFELTVTERELLNNVSNLFHQAGKKVIVVLNVGGVIETASWKHLADAILLPWSPGQEGANAVGDILAGRVNPSGKLPMTFPVTFFDHLSSFNFPHEYVRDLRRVGNEPLKDVDYTDYAEGIWVGYRHFDKHGVEVSYPFGYGLSYTSFDYSKPVVKAGKDGFTASVTVTNTGSVAGREVVQLYVSAPEGGLEKPEKELKAFGKTALLKPGESQTLSFTVSAYELASFNEGANRWETAKGAYTVGFASSSACIRCKGTFRQTAPQCWTVSDAFVK